jgi:hypothetical protein
MKLKINIYADGAFTQLDGNYRPICFRYQTVKHITSKKPHEKQIAGFQV